MANCCPSNPYDTVFGGRFARQMAKRYRRRGLSRTARRMVDFLAEQGLDGATVLEIGGGVGELQIELLQRGASHATNLEIATGYEEEAGALLEQAGLTDRVTRRIVDVADAPDEVEIADVVVLHRVVCCYPDYDKLLRAAGSRARRALVYSHPRRNPPLRAWLWLEHRFHQLTGCDFRAYAHPPAAMIDVLGRAGLQPKLVHRGFPWQVVGVARS